ncbi:hypothetical protein HELRODRAFT_167190 [Helobdella robusta]|uniref:Uncharacterized protein n=1 Tax=Helobdella robusta TaxID=6412 RepID=T1EZ43_HELRO|nr:hypothetical protein HELRODRAFT_167190 [Helobdella robusta]ESO10698.1 hypothetical protein HELRODRAFT_167190 [Helobdella robusta]
MDDARFKPICFFAISLFLGFSFILVGPTIFQKLFFGQLGTDNNFTEIWSVFFGRGLGAIIGYYMGLYIIPKSNTMLWMTLALLILAFSVGAISFCTDFNMMLIVLVTQGLSASVTRTSLQNLSKSMYGSSPPRNHASFTYMSWALGCVLGTLLILMFPVSRTVINDDASTLYVTSNVLKSNITMVSRHVRAVEDVSVGSMMPSLNFSDGSKSTSPSLTSLSPTLETSLTELISSTPLSEQSVSTSSATTSSSLLPLPSSSLSSSPPTVQPSPYVVTNASTASTNVLNQPTSSSTMMTSTLMTTNASTSVTESQKIANINSSLITNQSLITNLSQPIPNSMTPVPTRPLVLNGNSKNHHKEFASGHAINSKLKNNLFKNPLDTKLNDIESGLTPPTSTTTTTTRATISNATTAAANNTSTTNVASITTTTTKSNNGSSLVISASSSSPSKISSLRFPDNTRNFSNNATINHLNNVTSTTTATTSTSTATTSTTTATTSTTTATTTTATTSTTTATTSTTTANNLTFVTLASAPKSPTTTTTAKQVTSSSRKKSDVEEVIATSKAATAATVTTSTTTTPTATTPTATTAITAITATSFGVIQGSIEHETSTPMVKVINLKNTISNLNINHKVSSNKSSNNSNNDNNNNKSNFHWDVLYLENLKSFVKIICVYTGYHFTGFLIGSVIIVITSLSLFATYKLFVNYTNVKNYTKVEQKAKQRADNCLRYKSYVVCGGARFFIGIISLCEVVLAGFMPFMIGYFDSTELNSNITLWLFFSFLFWLSFFIGRCLYYLFSASKLPELFIMISGLLGSLACAFAMFIASNFYHAISSYVLIILFSLLALFMSVLNPSATNYFNKFALSHAVDLVQDPTQYFAEIFVATNLRYLPVRLEPGYLITALMIFLVISSIYLPVFCLVVKYFRTNFAVLDSRNSQDDERLKKINTGTQIEEEEEMICTNFEGSTSCNRPLLSS